MERVLVSDCFALFGRSDRVVLYRTRVKSRRERTDDGLLSVLRRSSPPTSTRLRATLICRPEPKSNGPFCTAQFWKIRPVHSCLLQARPPRGDQYGLAICTNDAGVQAGLEATPAIMCYWRDAFKLAPSLAFSACLPARRPNTTPLSSELSSRRSLPWLPPAARPKRRNQKWRCPLYQ